MLQRINSSCRRIVLLSVFIVSSFCGSQSWALDPDQFQKQNAFDGMELEDLMGLSISSLSKYKEPVSKAAAAVFVLTAEEIRRSPVTTLIEALRLIPGVNVERINNGQFHVSIRGFNGSFQRHLLVMVDGRSIYSSVYAGVFWQQRDLPLSIIDRIEVVRGPGGAIWGANALNGVINIITKSSKLQQSTEIMVQASSREQQLTAVTGGGEIGSEKIATWRAFADEHRYDQSKNRKEVKDQGQMRRAGIRIDQVLASELELQADFQLYQNDAYRKEYIYDNGAYGPRNITANINGFIFNTTISRKLSEDAQWDVQFLGEYYDWDIESFLREQLGMFDLSGQTRFLKGSHNLTFGANYRGYKDKFTGTETIKFEPDSEYNSLVSSFFQDQVLLAEHWKLTVGAKLEMHRFQSEFIQPTIRLSWFDDTSTLWMAYSNAVQAQSRGLRGVKWHLSCLCEHSVSDYLDFAQEAQEESVPVWVRNYAEANPDWKVPAYITLEGEADSSFETHVSAWELGVRSALGNGWVLDFSVYYNHYENMVVSAPTDFRVVLKDNVIITLADLLNPVNLVDHAEVILNYGEYLNAYASGADLVLTWQWGRNVNWRFAYSYFDSNIKSKSGEANFFENQEKVDPNQQVSLQYDWQVSERWHLNTFVRYVDKAPFFEVWDAVQAYTTVDSKVSFSMASGIDVFFVGKNLFDSGHVEGRVLSEQPEVETEVASSYTFGVSVTF